MIVAVTQLRSTMHFSLTICIRQCKINKKVFNLIYSSPKIILFKVTLKLFILQFFICFLYILRVKEEKQLKNNFFWYLNGFVSMLVKYNFCDQTNKKLIVFNLWSHRLWFNATESTLCIWNPMQENNEWYQVPNPIVF